MMAWSPPLHGEFLLLFRSFRSDPIAIYTVSTDQLNWDWSLGVIRNQGRVSFDLYLFRMKSFQVYLPFLSQLHLFRFYRCHCSSQSMYTAKFSAAPKIAWFFDLAHIDCCGPRNHFKRRSHVSAGLRLHDVGEYLPGLQYSLGQWNWVADVTEPQFDRAWSQKNAAQTPSDCGVGPEKELFLPCNANLHASSASLKHGLPPSSFFEWSSVLAHRLVVITHAIVKLRCKKETVESWQQST